MNNNCKKNILNTVDFIIYIIMLIYIFFFIKIIIFKNGFTNEFRLINLNPFLLILDKTISIDILLKNIAGNIIAFIPMAILLPILINKLNLRSTIILCFVISISIELLQYIFRLGVTDLADIILNLLGGLIGSILYFKLLKPFDMRLEYNIATLFFMVIFGLMFIFALWILQPNMLPKRNLSIGLEELEALDSNSYNVDALCISIKDCYINTYTLSEEDKINYNKEIDFNI